MDTSDFTEEVKKSRENAAMVLEHVKPLLELKGFEIMMKTLENQRKFRENQLVSSESYKGVEDVLRGEGLKGEIRGLSLARSLVPALVEMAERALEELEAENEEQAS